jgi:hypothetical protein
MVVVGGIFDKLFKKKKEPAEEEYYEPDYPPQDSIGPGEFDEESYPQQTYYNEPTDMKLISNIIYQIGRIEYRLKLRNISEDVLGDITVNLKSQKKSLVALIKSQQILEMLEPNKSIIMKFKLKPKYKTGTSRIFGSIEYFDFKSKERKIVRAPSAEVDFSFSKLTQKRVNEDEWRQAIGSLKSYDIESDIMDIPPNKLFNIFKSVINDVGLFMLPPIENVNLYRGIARFFGYDANRHLYAVEAQVIGDRTTSKVLYRIWSSEMNNAMALGFKTLDIIEDIIEIKKFIVET